MAIAVITIVLLVLSLAIVLPLLLIATTELKLARRNYDDLYKVCDKLEKQYYEKDSQLAQAQIKLKDIMGIVNGN